MDFAVSSEPFRSVMILRRFNTWFSVQNGLWDDPNTWISNAMDKHKVTVPQPGDNVWINNSVTLTGITNYTVNSIYGNGSLIFSNVTFLTVNGDIQMTGTVDQTASTCVLVLNGYNNSITNYTAAANSIMFYNGFYAQDIMPLSYGSLTTNNTGKKNLTANTTLSGNLLVRTNLECATYDLTVNGTTGIVNSNVGSFTKSGSGTIIFVGQVDAASAFSTVNLSGGNPNVEFRGGITMNSFVFNTGSGTFSFTANQNITQNGAGTTWNAPISIVGAVTLTVNGSQPLIIPTVINGTTGSSTLTISTRLYLGTTTTPMATGVFNYMPTSAAMVGYVMNSVFTLPYTTFAGLYIGGTGVKTLLGSTTLSGNLVVNNNLECSTFDLTVNGTTTVQNGGTDVFSKSGAGSLLFVGLFDASVGALNMINWSAGNPSVEFRGGLKVQSNSFNTGTGTFTFSTNNQNLNVISNSLGTWAAPILVSGSITLTNTGLLLGLIATGVLNGSGATSIFINNGGFTYNNATAPMATGKLYCNQAANTFVYGLAGGQDIQPPVDPVNPGYYNLTLQGSGAKKLLGNVSVKQVYTLTAPATLNSNGFALTNP